MLLRLKLPVTKDWTEEEQEVIAQVCGYHKNARTARDCSNIRRITKTSRNVGAIAMNIQQFEALVKKLP
ncbi:hypothetical protein ACX27_27440 [Nostoc piscinale CENA21]|uniref:Uncharacterized protein n=1 Tax=Nostoc piscinale CENA21 TaxID=224013 RepID=A0A0M5MLV7_9NOSO|nr:hypothetical protein ACX27_27440 [Nostoc piscinale CENA21]